VLVAVRKAGFKKRKEIPDSKGIRRMEKQGGSAFYQAKKTPSWGKSGRRGKETTHCRRIKAEKRTGNEWLKDGDH